MVNALLERVLNLNISLGEDSVKIYFQLYIKIVLCTKCGLCVRQSGFDIASSPVESVSELCNTDLSSQSSLTKPFVAGKEIKILSLPLSLAAR